MKRERKRKIKRNKGKGKGKQDQRGPSRGPKSATNEREKEGIDVASMWLDLASVCIDVTSTWHRCGIDVASMWIDVASMCHRCGWMWHRCVMDADRRLKKMKNERMRRIIWNKGKVKGKQDQRGLKRAQEGPK